VRSLCIVELNITTTIITITTHHQLVLDRPVSTSSNSLFQMSSKSSSSIWSIIQHYFCHPVVVIVVVVVVVVVVVFNNVKVLSLAQNCFYGEYNISLKNKTYLGLDVKSSVLCAIVTKFGFSRQILTEVPQYQISREYVQWEPG
jgi:hypothetical protein